MNRVLIIEDDAVARRQLVQLFRFEEFEVSEAESGETGVAVSRTTTPDLVVCDIMMPGMDGFGVLAALRARAETALTPFIFLTAKAGGKDVREGMNQGADDYITKPFDPDALLASARQRLARRQAQLDEAERRAADTGMLAAAALPREMEDCLTQLETLGDAILARLHGDGPAQEASRLLKNGVARLRTMSRRLRLYAELPSLYARRFSAPGDAGEWPAAAVADAARAAARMWNREQDLDVPAAGSAFPLPAQAAEVIVRELVDNACKFSPPGARVSVAVSSGAGCRKMVVADGGPGMEERQIRQVGAFQQFWNGTERPQGLGIGLALVQTLVRLHGGEVLIESAAGTGTQVTVMVPSE